MADGIPRIRLHGAILADRQGLFRPSGVAQRGDLYWADRPVPPLVVGLTSFGMTRDQRSGVWESLGEIDPDWAVESRADRMHGGWQHELDEFYETGRRRLDEALVSVPLENVRKVLDYGSGTGRLSFALAERFGSVTSADISSSMLRTLRERAANFGVAGIETVDLAHSELPTDHDLALCLITLQHFPDWASVDAALRAIHHSLRPGGYFVVDIPARPHHWRRRLQLKFQAYRALSLLRISPARLYRYGLSGISMRWEPNEAFRRRLNAAGFEVVSDRSWSGSYYQSAEYIARRPEAGSPPAEPR